MFSLTSFSSLFKHSSQSLSLLLLLFLELVAAQGLSQHFESSPAKNLTVLRGTTLTIPCRVRNRQGECLWIHDGKGVGLIHSKYDFKRTPDNGDCSLTIYDISLESDNGLWQCQVTAAAVNQETLQSDTIGLLVLITPERPAIRRTVFADKKKNDIECQVANGNPAPVINWLLNDRDITEHSISTVLRNEKGSKGSAFTTSSRLDYAIERNQNNANLTCYAYHPTVNQTDSVILDVLYAPIVNVSKNRYSVMEGSELRVDCKVDANPKTTGLWKRVGSIASAPSARGESHVLYYDRVPRDLNGAVFECSAQNDLGVSFPAQVTLDVLYTPRLLNTSIAQSVLAGNAARLQCIYDGNPSPSIKWFHVNPRTSETNQIYRQSKREQEHIFEIKNATYINEGEYFCEATNQINGIDYVVRSSNIMLDIYGLPAFLTTIPFATEGKRGGQSHVSLWFCSDPPPSKVYWQFGSIRLDVSNLGHEKNGHSPRNASLHSRYVIKPLIPLHSKRTLESASNCYDSTLLIKDTDLSDQRDYTLIIENERGFQEGVVRLRVVNPLSATLLIATALSVIILVFVVSVVTLMFIRRKRKGEENIRDEEAKEDAQALSQNMKTPHDTGQVGKPVTEKGKGENHELVYANLDFTKDAKPQPRAKPPVHQRTQQKPIGNSSSGTEYAQLAFPNKADL